MPEITRFTLPERADHEEVDGDACLAIFSAECLHGRPQTLLEASYFVAPDGRQCVFNVRGPAGETALRVFVGLCTERFGAGRFKVERQVTDGVA